MLYEAITDLLALDRVDAGLGDTVLVVQEGAQGRGEVQTDRLVHLHLVDPGKVELDRVLRRRESSAFLSLV